MTDLEEQVSEETTTGSADKIRHAYCTICTSTPDGMTWLPGPQRALCGAVDTPGNDLPRWEIPPNACVVCIDLLPKPCQEGHPAS